MCKNDTKLDDLFTYKIWKFMPPDFEICIFTFSNEKEAMEMFETITKAEEEENVRHTMEITLKDKS